MLEHGWAYGKGGDRLRGKLTFNAITAGGPTTPIVARATTGSRRASCCLRGIRPHTCAACAISAVRGARRAADRRHDDCSSERRYRKLIEALRDDRSISTARAPDLPTISITISPRWSHDDDMLAQALVYLAAAVVFVPLSKRLGLGAVLGYLVAGVMIGPFVLGFVGDEGHQRHRFAEFGCRMMLFLVGPRAAAVTAVAAPQADLRARRRAGRWSPRSAVRARRSRRGARPSLRSRSA